MGHAPRNSLGAIDWGSTQRRARELLASLDINDLDVGSVVGTLSVGNRQRLRSPRRSRTTRASSSWTNRPRRSPSATWSGCSPSCACCASAVSASSISATASRRYSCWRTGSRFCATANISRRSPSPTPTATCWSTTWSDGASICCSPSYPPSIGNPGVELAPGPCAAHARYLPTLCTGEIVGPAGWSARAVPNWPWSCLGVTPAEAGAILLDGKPVMIDSPITAKHLGIAYVPEDLGIQGLVRPMRIRENVSMAVLKQVAQGWSRPRQGNGAGRVEHAPVRHSGSAASIRWSTSSRAAISRRSC